MVMVVPRPNVIYPLDEYLKELLDTINLSVREKNISSVTIMDGKSGKGKSTLAFQIAMYLDPTFDLDRIHFDVQKFLEALTFLKKGQAIVFDEALILSNRSSLSALNRSMVYAMSMIRSKNIHVIFCANSIFDLDRNISVFRADLLIHVYGEGLAGRGRFAAFFKSKGDGIDRIKQLYLLGRKMYDYGRPKANFVGKFSDKMVVDETEYNKMKDESVNKFLNNPTASKGETKHSMCLKRVIRYVIEKDRLPIKQLSEISGLTEKTLYNYVNEMGLSL